MLDKTELCLEGKDSPEDSKGLELLSLIHSLKWAGWDSWNGESVVPEIALGSKIPAHAKHSKDGKTPLLSKIATRGLETKAVTSTMEFEGATMRHLLT